MADLNDLTTNVNIWNDDKSKSVTVTTDGPKERLDVAATIEAAGNFPLEVQYNKSFAAVNANEWQEVADYTVPTGYQFSVTSFRCYSATAGEEARVIVETIAGTYECSTNTFTDGDAIASPQFASGVYILLTTANGNANDVITITYTNEHGTTGRTCTISLAKNSLLGTHIEGVLEGDDIGIRDVTNVTSTATQAGAFAVEMYYSIFSLLMTSSGTMYQATSISGSPVSIPADGKIVLQVLAGTKTSYSRDLSLFGGLA